MLGRKVSQSKLFYGLSLDALVPSDDFYRKLEAAVDLSWVRGRVADRYAAIGRPSIDPEVIVKIELIGYLEGITSERQLLRQAADRLSLRRYLGYDLDEVLPDHSTLSRARALFGLALFQAVFDTSVRLCQAAGMVSGLALSVDKTLVKANASLDSLEPRRVLQSAAAFVQQVFAENAVPDDPPAHVVRLAESAGTPTPCRPAALDGAASPRRPVVEPVATASEATPAPVSPDGAPGVTKVSRRQATNATHVSRTDPEASVTARRDLPPILAYSAEFLVDSRRGVLTHADATTASLPEQATVAAAVVRERAVFGLPVAALFGDKGYGQGRLYRQLDDLGVRGFIPHQTQAHDHDPDHFGPADFPPDPASSGRRCPEGKVLPHVAFEVHWPGASHVWHAHPADCATCPQRERCTTSAHGRKLRSSIYDPDYARMAARVRGPGARLAAIARRTGPEPRFAQAKQWQGLDRAKYRGLVKMRGQVLLTAAAQNLKKYVAWTWRHHRGGRRSPGAFDPIPGRTGLPTRSHTDHFGSVIKVQSRLFQQALKPQATVTKPTSVGSPRHPRR